MWENIKIINERPEGMSYEEYRYIRKYQTEILRMYRKLGADRTIKILAAAQEIEKQSE
jgi:hypothetical protein